MKLKTINKVISSGYCLGCGLCCVIDKNSMIVEKDGNIKSTYHNNKHNGHISVCPAAGYDIINLGKKIHSASKYSYELGWYNKLKLAQSGDEIVLKKASSGGAMTTIALFMLEKGYADGVICTRYSFDRPEPRPITYIARNKADLLRAQGSKYCPTSILTILKDLNAEEKYVLIGTPCQIAGWQKYKKEYKPSINIVLTIANFCGGYRDYREIDYFVHNIAGFNKASFFQHRGDGVPGFMRIIDEKGTEWKYPYPEYVRLSPIRKNKRCVYCIDATGELADISCGDAWIDRIKETKEPWSSLILRNEKAVNLLKQIVENNYLRVGDVTESEVIQSQKLNITSKKYRQFKRIRITRIFLGNVPNWFDCVKDLDGSYIGECKILLSKFIKNTILKKR